MENVIEQAEEATLALGQDLLKLVVYWRGERKGGVLGKSAFGIFKGNPVVFNAQRLRKGSRITFLCGCAEFRMEGACGHRAELAEELNKFEREAEFRPVGSFPLGPGQVGPWIQPQVIEGGEGAVP